MKSLSFIFSMIFIFAITAYGQINLTPDFQKKLDQSDVSFASPLENSFINISIQKNDILNCDWAIQQQKGDLEIRAYVQPNYSSSGPIYPQINCASMASTVATNKEDAVIVRHSISSENVAEEYGADWGSFLFFQPKSSFSDKNHCKMLMLHKEGFGSIYIFYLFNEPIHDLDRYKTMFQFKR